MTTRVGKSIPTEELAVLDNPNVKQILAYVYVEAWHEVASMGSSPSIPHRRRTVAESRTNPQKFISKFHI